MRTDTPILFLYLEGNTGLMPKGRVIPLPGKLRIHVGPVHPPADIDEIYEDYRDWVLNINPGAYRPEGLPEPEEEHIPDDESEDE
jgi:1-acyl-sn-glycerol-3-phosphate acyltransferase